MNYADALKDPEFAHLVELKNEAVKELHRLYEKREELGRQIDSVEIDADKAISAVHNWLDSH